jgi:hypothetical protein
MLQEERNNFHWNLFSFQAESFWIAVRWLGTDKLLPLRAAHISETGHNKFFIVNADSSML